jgi:hypothetical protein
LLNASVRMMNTASATSCVSTLASSAVANKSERNDYMRAA